MSLSHGVWRCISPYYSTTVLVPAWRLLSSVCYFLMFFMFIFFFFFQAEDGIRDLTVTGVQTCALAIFLLEEALEVGDVLDQHDGGRQRAERDQRRRVAEEPGEDRQGRRRGHRAHRDEIGRASCRERVESSVVAGAGKRKKGELKAE